MVLQLIHNSSQKERMPSHDFIDVRIIVDSSPLPEYPDPEAGDDDEGRTHTRYVEAKTDQTFGVQVKLQRGFDFRSAIAVFYKFEPDDAPTFFPGRLPKCQASHRNGILSNEMESLCESARLKNTTTGKWNWHPFVFGALEMNDSVPEASLEPGKLENLGSIRVKVYRAMPKELALPQVWNGKRPEALDKVSEKSLKGKAIENNVKIGARGTPARPPKISEYKWIPVPGEAGKIYRFNFLYRSRKILQSLGCIPRSPSPPRDPSLALERTEEMLKLSKRQARETNLELMRVRAQLAEAERQLRSTSLRHDTTPSSSTVGVLTPSVTATRDNSVDPEVDLYKRYPTNTSIQRETNNDIPDLSVTVSVEQRMRPIPPLLDLPNQPTKRATEGGDDKIQDWVRRRTEPNGAKVLEVIDLTDD